LYQFLHSSSGTEILHDLREAGVRLSQDVAKTQESEWTGKSVVITGRFDTCSRDELTARLVQLGARVSGAVSSKTDAVFAGEDAGSKFDKAVALKVPIYREDVVKQIMSRSL
jgi:DNA ligase (NAD+)